MSSKSLIDQNGDDPSSSNVQVIISSDPGSTQTQQKPTIPGDATDNTLKREKLLNEYALDNKWNLAKLIYDEFHNMVRIPLNFREDTALHVAVSANHVDFVRELVNYEHVTKEDLEIRNGDGNTAYCLAAITGTNRDDELLKIMIEKNEELPLIRGQDGMLPDHLAVSLGNNKIVLDQSFENRLKRMDFKDIERLLFMVINSSMYDVAMYLVEKYPDKLIIARDDEENLTALHMVARKLSIEFDIKENKEGSPRELLKKLWEQVRELEYKMRLELITEPSVVLFDAVKSGNLEVVKWLLKMNDELLTIKDPKNGQSVLHIAVSFRQHDIFDFILKMRTVNLVIRAVDNDRNNVLHFAARVLKEESSTLKRFFHMRRVIARFEKVKNSVPGELRTKKNKEDETPNDIVDDIRKNPSKEFKEAAEKLASSGMVVAALIATVSFTAILTPPPSVDHKSDKFTWFIMANAVGLSFSCMSIACFLSIFTLPKQKYFTPTLRARMIGAGQFMLLYSNAAMLFAFTVASFLILHDTGKDRNSYSVLVALYTLMSFILFFIVSV